MGSSRENCVLTKGGKMIHNIFLFPRGNYLARNSEAQANYFSDRQSQQGCQVTLSSTVAVQYIVGTK